MGKGKRWTLDEDRFLHFYYDGLGDFIGEHDLGRPKGAATQRVHKLKATGAWEAIGLIQKAEDEYHKRLGKL